jgi:two-component system sensor histidine kinase FlrB
MTARLGHQFRTPLASALLYASQLENPELFDREEVAGKIIGRLQDLAAMMDDMLRYAAGAKNSDETVFVADLFRDVVDAIGPQFDSADQLSIEVENPELTVDVNVTALKGALLNLVSNAIQASGDSPQVELGAVCSRDEVCLTVTDHGDGIDDDLRSRIFEPFFTTRPQGTGLGLAVVRSVAEAHGGEVLVDSGPGGTTFAICIPASSRKPEVSPAEAAAEKDDD